MWFSCKKAAAVLSLAQPWTGTWQKRTCLMGSISLLHSGIADTPGTHTLLVEMFTSQTLTFQA